GHCGISRNRACEAIVRHIDEKESASACSASFTGCRVQPDRRRTLGLDTSQISTLGYALFFPRINENSSVCRSFKLSTPEPICFCSSFDLRAGSTSSPGPRRQEN